MRSTMSSDAFPELLRLQPHLSALDELAAGARSALPERVSVADGSGTVWVVLGPDGLPESFHVDAEWRRALGSEAFGDAVVEAYRAAADERTAEWNRTIEEGGWRERFGRLRAEVDSVETAGGTPVLPSPAPTPPRPLTEVL